MPFADLPIERRADVRGREAIKGTSDKVDIVRRARRSLFRAGRNCVLKSRTQVTPVLKKRACMASIGIRGTIFPPYEPILFDDVRRTVFFDLAGRSLWTAALYHSLAIDETSQFRAVTSR
jgi:hypothetical protein